MYSKWLKSVMVLSVAGFAMAGVSVVSAHHPNANWTDSRGAPVLDGQGECWRTINWTPERVEHSNCAGYIEPAPVVAPPAVAPPPTPAAPQFTTTTLSAETLFDFDSATLRPAGRDTLRNLASQLTAASATYTSVLVEGHTCNIGAAAYNQGLSERRAQSVVDYLVSQGVRPEAIRSVGYGLTRPMADNATHAGREQNRRVEITTDVRVRVN